MPMSVEKRITRELARLRMWRDVANDEECALETQIAHDRINSLLDEWEAKHSHGRTKPAVQSKPSATV